MKNKIILITGATDGIGKQTAIALISMGARVIIHGRNNVSCRKAIDVIRKKTKISSVDYISCDLSSLTEVKEMSKNIKDRYEKIDVLINNAGVYETEKILTLDGYERTFAVNHLAHFILTISLLDVLKLSTSSRIINVSSVAHQNCDFDLENLNAEKKFDSYNSYAISKAANVLFTYKLAEKIKGENVTVNALHPGVITTKLLYKGFGIQGASLESGAETTVYLASSSELENVTGKYFSDSKKKESAQFTYDKELQQKFWDLSYKMIKRYL